MNVDTVDSLLLKRVKQLEPVAEVGRLVLQGIKEVLPRTGCRGEYKSLGCREVLKTNQHGCVLMYYCQFKREGRRD